MEIQHLEETILAILSRLEASLGLTREALRESKLPPEHQNDQVNLTLNDWHWRLSEFESALLNLRIARKIVLFKPTKGRKKDNGKTHYILTEHAPTVGADPEQVGDFQIARTQ